MQFQDEKKCFLIYFKTNMMQFLDEKKLLLTTRSPARCKTWMRRRCSWSFEFNVMQFGDKKLLLDYFKSDNALPG